MLQICTLGFLSFYMLLWCYRFTLDLIFFVYGVYLLLEWCFYFFFFLQLLANSLVFFIQCVKVCAYFSPCWPLKHVSYNCYLHIVLDCYLSLLKYLPFICSTYLSLYKVYGSLLGVFLLTSWRAWEHLDFVWLNQSLVESK